MSSDLTRAFAEPHPARAGVRAVRRDGCGVRSAIRDGAVTLRSRRHRRPTPTRPWRCSPIRAPRNQSARRLPLQRQRGAAYRSEPDAERRTVWASWNYIGRARAGDALCVTYWMNRLQDPERPAAVRDPQSAARRPRRHSSHRNLSTIHCSMRAAMRRRSSCGRCRAGATPGSAAPISAPAFTRTACRPAWPSPKRSAACAGHGGSPNESGRIVLGPPAHAPAAQLELRHEPARRSMSAR